MQRREGVTEKNLSFGNEAYAEELYSSWKREPHSVPQDWKEYFEALDIPTVHTPPPQTRTAAGHALHPKQGRVHSLIWGYRDVGYLYARLNPLVGYLAADLLYLHKQEEGLYERLTLREFDLGEEELEAEFSTGRYFEPRRATLREIITMLRETYCSSIGVEFLHIQNKPMRSWIIEKMETSRGKNRLDASQRLRILSDLLRAEVLERFLHTTFIGQKRFSLEGSEVLISALHSLVDTAVEADIEEIVIGMSHRGRLNVLSRILNKPADEIFSEFEDIVDPELYGGSGDVKYHKGYRVDHVHEDGKRIGITLVPNPSHLESVDPVVEGMARGIQLKKGALGRSKVIPLLIHGDAAFSGQGVVAETLNLSQLNGYTTGGSIHIVMNNQIGFTTSTKDARSTFFPTDVGKMLPIPIFHVNGDDPEAVIFVTDLAFQFRERFKSDIIIDIFCYRRHGHNEGDEPSFTHPRMYHHIKYHDSVAKIYSKKLVEQNLLTEERIRKIEEEERAALKQALDRTKSGYRAKTASGGSREDEEENATAVMFDTLKMITQRISSIPEGFNIHNKLERIVKEREKRFMEGKSIDFSLAESLAFGSLLLEGIPVRLSGEDSARGTFSQRHTVWWDTESSRPYSHTPLNRLSVDQAQFVVYDSPLSEFSVLGFEYGYALARPDSLVLWEAQFGDFCNGAQVIIDNYIAAGEKKWQAACNLVMLLPHGYEGQGPEHSSAHMERFLQLSADENMYVCIVSTPAQYFHLLRRQAKQRTKKPLIIFTPKSLLRAKTAVSQIEEFTNGEFSSVIDDPDGRKTASVLCFCAGKIYYELSARKSELKRVDPAIIRIEQLSPFPLEEIEAALKRYPRQKELIWVQEEPKNRGAWTYIQDKFSKTSFSGSLKYIGRVQSASPATGSHRKHKIEQEAIIESVFKTIQNQAPDGTTRRSEKKERVAH